MTDIIKSILAINPNAEVSVNAEDINQITWLNGTAPISKSEIQAMIPIVQEEILNKEQAKIDAEQSAINKLKALGLTDAEVKAFRG